MLKRPHSPDEESKPDVTIIGTFRHERYDHLYNPDFDPQIGDVVGVLQEDGSRVYAKILEKPFLASPLNPQLYQFKFPNYGWFT